MNLRAFVFAVAVTSTLFGFAGDTSSKPKITKEQARSTAMARHQGTVKSSELERENGRWMYSFDIQTAEGIREVQVDANTGNIVEDKIESAADEAKEAAEEKQKQAPTKKQSPNGQSSH